MEEKKEIPEVTYAPMLGAWLRGHCNADGERLEFCVRRTVSPNPAGLSGGRIVNLQLRANGCTLVLYNRGWDLGMKPFGLSAAARCLYNYLLETLN